MQSEKSGAAVNHGAGCRLHLSQFSFGMIQKVRIQNFKSVLDLELELGRVNVFIGENGSGKTSVLEGIAMGSAAAANRMENEFLGTRIRNVDPNLMTSAFPSDKQNGVIHFDFGGDGSSEQLIQQIIHFSSGNKNWIPSNILKSPTSKERQLIIPEVAADVVQEMKEVTLTLEDSKAKEFFDYFVSRLRSITSGEERFPAFTAELTNYLLYAPENHFLRRFEEEGQIRPLGIRGEGLFRHLTELAKEQPETLAKISEQLQLIDWFEGFSIPNDLQFTERRIAITDRFIKDTIAQIDQRSANEGFLYLLFYFTLFLSKYTPAFFAIDNIDNALNPRLCAKLVETLVGLAKENDKQAIFTTHNPAVLDGLDLTDDAQRLFVIYRNADGETKARRVMPPRKVEGVEPVRLSEAFVRGYLGGLPQNF